MDNKKRNQKAERERRNKLYTRFGHLIGLPTVDIPERHRAHSGGLRCFRKVHPRDEHGNKDRSQDKVRCKNVCSKGSLYCRHHGGGNAKALVHGKRMNQTIMEYKGVHKPEMQDLFIAFLNDPKILDMKAELATLRLVLNNYIRKLASGETQSPRRLVSMMEEILGNPESTDREKFLAIKEIVDSQTDLASGHAIDRINRTVETIGKVIERIHRIETKDDFMMTPEGIKVLLRAVHDIVQLHVDDVEKLNGIKNSLLKASVLTGGDLTKYKSPEVIDADYEMVKDKEND